jgi:hypothetical protein
MEVIAYERPDATTAGAGIALFSNGLRALDTIGLGDAVRTLGAPPNIPAGLRTPHGRWLVRPSPAATPEFTVVHRGDLRDILAAAAPDVQLSTVVAVHSTASAATVALDSGATRTSTWWSAPKASAAGSDVPGPTTPASATPYTRPGAASPTARSMCRRQARRTGAWSSASSR